MTTAHRRNLVARITSALETAARLVEVNPIYLPIFARLDAELTAAVAGASPVERARLLLKAEVAA